MRHGEQDKSRANCKFKALQFIGHKTMDKIAESTNVTTLFHGHRWVAVSESTRENLWGGTNHNDPGIRWATTMLQDGLSWRLPMKWLEQADRRHPEEAQVFMLVWQCVSHACAWSSHLRALNGFWLANIFRSFPSTEAGRRAGFCWTRCHTHSPNVIRFLMNWLMPPDIWPVCMDWALPFKLHWGRISRLCMYF